MLFSFQNYRFTAPVRGLYWFTVTMRAESVASVTMRVNGQLIETRATDEESAAVSAILMMEAGDRVDCVKRYDVHQLFDDVDRKHNILAGFLYTQLDGLLPD